MEMVFINGVMDKNMKENLKTINFMETEYYIIKMDEFLKENFTKVKNMEKEF